MDSVAQAVNQHAYLIKVISSEVKTKVTSVEVSEALNLIASAVPAQLVEAQTKPDPTTLKEAAVKTAENVAALSTHILRLQDFESHTTTRLKEVQTDLDTKASVSELKKSIKSIKKKLKSKLEDKVKEINATIKHLEAALSERLAQLDKKISDVEVNTVWKLKDVEELLKVRVSEQFVWDAINSTVGKSKKDLKDISQALSDRMERMQKALEQQIEKVENVDRNSTERLNQQLQRLEEQ